jgi:hypothetical protein
MSIQSEPTKLAEIIKETILPRFQGGAFEPRAGVEGEVESPKVLKWCLFQPRTEHCIEYRNIYEDTFMHQVRVA